MKKNNKNAPSLDLSFAYGTGVMKQLTENDIRAINAEAQTDPDDNSSTGDTTIRAITSLYTGRRHISGLDVDVAAALMEARSLAAQESDAEIEKDQTEPDE